MSVSATSKIEVQLSVGVWTDISADVLGSVRAHFGINGNGPADCMASTGELSFDLDNGTHNSGGLLGFYSPLHANVRTGWTFGIPVRWTITYSATDYVRFRGKVGVIDPLPGQYRDRRVRVVCYDYMNDLLSTKVRDISIAISQNENTLIGNVLDALPSDAQPPARSLDAGIDTYPYAFDNVEGGILAGTLLRDIILSGLGAGFITGNGTFTYKTRRNRASGASALTLSNDMIDLVVPTTLDGVYNRVHTTIHPKTIDAAATSVLASQTGTAPSISAGSSLTVWLNYQDPTQTSRLVGGTAMVTPIVATTDYTANDNADGSGTDRTASVSIATTAFASSAKFVITNNFSGTVYITKLQIRGKGVYDNGPRTYESYTAKTYGDRLVDVDLPYQDSASFGQDAASYLNSQYNSLTNQVSSVQFVATKTNTLMLAALQREPTNVITITEAMTGLSSTKAVIYGIELEWTSSKQLLCRFSLGPRQPFAFWQVGTVGASELGTTTILGF